MALSRPDQPITPMALTGGKTVDWPGTRKGPSEPWSACHRGFDGRDPTWAHKAIDPVQQLRLQPCNLAGPSRIVDPNQQL